jgi:hypothetical protein
MADELLTTEATAEEAFAARTNRKHKGDDQDGGHKHQKDGGKRHHKETDEPEDGGDDFPCGHGGRVPECPCGGWGDHVEGCDCECAECQAKKGV